MINNLYFQVSGLLIIVFLLIKYLSKRRETSIDSSIFLMLLTTNLAYLMGSFLIVFSVYYLNADFFLSKIFGKLNLIILFIWILALTMHVYVITFKKKERIDNENTFNIKKYFLKTLPFIFIVITLILVLPINMVYEANTIYISGYSYYFMSIISIFIILYWIYRVMKRHNHIKEKYKNMVLSFSFIGICAILFQYFYPTFIVIDFVIYFITFIMYFNIENSDMEIIEQLNESKKKIEEVEAIKTDTLIKISHEIRTSLNSIIGFSESIMQDSSENVKDDAGYIKEASEKLLLTANNILDNNSPNEVQIKLIESEYNFEGLMKQVIAGSQSKTSDSKIDFKYKISELIPKNLYGDNISLKQALTNILDNSVKFTKEGYIYLDVSNIIIGNTCRLIISIKDTGIGISSTKLENIYQKNPVNKQYETSITQAKNIIEAMGGQLFIESEYGEGTSVRISVDQRISRDKIENNLQNKETTESETKKILIVDDDKLNLKVAERLLKNYNLVIDTVTSGEMCINKIENKEYYNLIFMDEMMPNMSGTETLRILKNIKDFNIPVVALTANALPGMKEAYLKEGFDDFIAKPIDKKELDRVLKKYL